MSRLCVKNLPKNLTEEKLKDVFGSKGEVTDVKIAKTKSGKSRLFAFIGFRNEDQAKVAMDFFNNSFIGSSRVTVESAKRFGDPLLLGDVRSKHSRKKLLKRIREESNNETQQLKSTTSVPSKISFKESKERLDFFEVAKARNQSKFWSNDESGANGAVVATHSPADISGEEYLSQKAEGEGSDDESYENTDFESRVEDLPVTELSDFDYLRRKKSKTSESMTGDSAAADKRKMRKRSDYTSSNDEEEEEDEQEGDVCTADDDDEIDDNKDDESSGGAESGRLFIRNLSYACTEDELREYFSRFGPVTEVHLPLDADKRRKGFGFVSFMIPEHAEEAIRVYDGAAYQGRLLHVILAKERGTGVGENTWEEDSKKCASLSAYQKQKETERRTLAGKKDSWNASFVRSDTVVASLAERYGMRPHEVLDSSISGGEMAVRLAIGETQVIQENKEYFLSHGVDISAMESLSSAKRASERSTTTLLIKNLPHDVNEAELEAMFSRFGALGSFLFPPNRAVALVDFLEPSEARNAFKGLAYRRYKHVPLYLEWAPVGLIDKTKIKVPKAAAKSSLKASDKSASAGSNELSTAASLNDINQSDNVADRCTLFLKNLSFETNEDALREHMLRRGLNSNALRAVSISRKAKGSAMLSMGFGFAEFRTHDDATAALSMLQGSVLDGHALELKPSQKKLTANLPASSSSSTKHQHGNGTVSEGGKKLVVRNVAFQTTPAELRALFSAFGSIKRLRIPRRIGGVHRGFAFIEFATAQESQNAMASLGNTHLYGRHLVLEWAKEDDDGAGGDMDKLRKRARLDVRVAQATASAQRLDAGLLTAGGGVGGIRGKGAGTGSMPDERVDLDDEGDDGGEEED